MKNLIASILFVLLSFSAIQAQSYLDPTATWYEREDWDDIIEFRHRALYSFTMCGDTNISGFNYHKVWKTGTDSIFGITSNVFLAVEPIDSLILFLREDGAGRWFVRWAPPNNPTEFLMYDFNWQVGTNVSSWQCGTPEPINSISTFPFNGQTLKKFEIGPFWSMREGIGSWNGLIGTLNCIMYHHSSYLICFHQNGDTLINWTPTFSCANIPTHNCALTANEPSIEQPSTTVSPNPSNGQFRLEISEGSALETIEVVGMDGQLLRQISAKRANSLGLDIDLSDLADGIYFLRIQSSDQNPRIHKVAVIH